MNNETTAARRPPMQPSDEGDAPGLKLAKKQGEAFMETVRHMVEDIAERGQTKRAGEYVVGCAVEKAEGLYQLRDGRLKWEEPQEENIHIEIIVCDGADNRFIPNLKVSLTVKDADGEEIGTHEQPFLWHPYLYHYGRNWKVPGDGEYDLHVRIETPDFPRHDKENGRRYAEPVEVEFASVKFETGKG